MNRDKTNDNTNGFHALAAFRGLYNRVAMKLNVDPSYVSRVARGERRSATVLAALEEEVARIREQLNHQMDGKGNADGHQGPDGTKTGVGMFPKDDPAADGGAAQRASGNFKRPRN